MDDQTRSRTLLRETPGEGQTRDEHHNYIHRYVAGLLRAQQRSDKKITCIYRCRYADFTWVTNAQVFLKGQSQIKGFDAELNNHFPPFFGNFHMTQSVRRSVVCSVGRSVGCAGGFPKGMEVSFPCSNILTCFNTVVL